MIRDDKRNIIRIMFSNPDSKPEQMEINISYEEIESDVLSYLYWGQMMKCDISLENILSVIRKHLNYSCEKQIGATYNLLNSHYLIPEKEVLRIMTFLYADKLIETDRGENGICLVKLLEKGENVCQLAYKK